MEWPASQTKRTNVHFFVDAKWEMQLSRDEEEKEDGTLLEENIVTGGLRHCFVIIAQPKKVSHCPLVFVEGLNSPLLRNPRNCAKSIDCG